MEQRKHPRLMGPFDARWRGASGGGTCRIGDISLGGCFVQTMAMPIVGERTSVSVELDDKEFLLPRGTVVSTEWGIGFAVEFKPLGGEELAELKNIIGRLRQRRKTA
jgi:hypothetical protein